MIPIKLEHVSNILSLILIFAELFNYCLHSQAGYD